MSECFCVIDAGNRTVHIGCADRDRIIAHGKLPSSPRELNEGFSSALSRFCGNDCSGAVVASVVPDIDAEVSRLCGKHLSVDPVFVGPGTDAGVRIEYDDPSEVGADRISNAAGAFALYGAPVIVVDFGTAITFDIVAEGGVYLGGVIAPGLDMGPRCLAEGTALLPRVEMRRPEAVIGKSTTAAIRSGIYFGACGLIERVLEELEKEGLRGSRIVFTGGGAEMVAGAVDRDVTVNPLLTLEGLRIIYCRIARK